MEFLRLLCLRAFVYLYEGFEFVKVVFRFYPNSRFRRHDLSLIRSYLFVNPYTVCKKHLLSKGAADPYLYGETPLTTFAEIVKRCGVKACDTVIEAGCGRGRACFWLADFVGCKVVGIEEVELFVEKANHIKKQCSLSGVSFYQGNYLDFSFKDATVVYLYGTCLEDSSIRLLFKKFSKMSAGSKIITVSYPLTDYLDCASQGMFKLVDSFEVSFPWGRSTVYLQVKN